MLQEATAYLAAVEGSDKKHDFNELNERLISAAIAGTTLGAGFATPGAVRQAVLDFDHQAKGELATGDYESQSGIYAAQEKAERGYVPSIEENIANTRLAIAEQGIGATQADRAEALSLIHISEPTRPY